MAGIHGPLAAIFRIPGERQFDQRAASGPMQVGSDVVARTHYIVDAGFLDFGFLAGESDAPAPLIVSATTFLDRIPGSGRLVKEANRLDGRGLGERARHARLGKARSDFRMAGSALGL